MRNILALVGALVVMVGGAGYFLGWYKVNKVDEDGDSKTYNVEINKSKLGKDLKKSKEYIDRKLHGGEEPSIRPDELEPPSPFGPGGKQPVKVEVPPVGTLSPDQMPPLPFK